MNVFAEHHLVMQIEARGFDTSAKHTGGILEEVSIVFAATAIRVNDRHTMATASSTGPLPVVRRLWRRVTHQNHIKCANIYTHLQRRSGNQTVVLPIELLELVFNRLALFGGHLR